MTPKQINIAIALLLSLLTTGCDEPLDKLVEVTIVSVWTPEDYNKHFSMNTPFPHTVVTRSDNGERARIARHTWGKVGDSFKVRESKLF